jgi:ATP-dependent helicase/nuclease subunit B
LSIPSGKLHSAVTQTACKIETGETPASISFESAYMRRRIESPMLGMISKNTQILKTQCLRNLFTKPLPSVTLFFNFTWPVKQRDKMTVKLIIGPAGSGKSFRCLDQIRAELEASPDGEPLLMLAPKQSTFQLERQLLGMGLPGFTRLQILSFDRLARYVLEKLGIATPGLLSEEGRVMVVRALILRHEQELKAFKSAARSAGLATQVSQVLREFQRNRINPTQPGLIENQTEFGTRIVAKLHDLGLLLNAYREWLEEHQLQDPDSLLELASSELNRLIKGGKRSLAIRGLWMDGFAEMTLPEIDLLAAVLSSSDSATLAFCLDREPKSSSGPENGGITEGVPLPLLWSVTAQTFLRCKNRIIESGSSCVVEDLGADRKIQRRFSQNPGLGKLAESWVFSGAKPRSKPEDFSGLNLFECVDPEAEALLAARLINEHVHDRNGRYREVTVIVRRMDDYASVLQRTFRRHGIPFFADHREPMGHHPIAELTRNVLRMAAYGWQNEDWLGALKTGLAIDNPQLIDALENVALSKGITGAQWQSGDFNRHLTSDASQQLRGPVLVFSNLLKVIAEKPDGAKLARAIYEFWAGLKVTDKFDQWQERSDDLPPLYRSIHQTAWEQINSWCDNLALAFDNTPMDAADWLAIAEAGLSRLTLGVIPPSLDQVLVGAIDRARQPDVKLAIVLGFNEGVFPAAPPQELLLNRAERQLLAQDHEFNLGLDRLQYAAREQFFAYIACTRASERLCVSWSRRNLAGKSLTRSSAADHLLAATGLKPEQVAKFDGTLKVEDLKSAAELYECHFWPRLLPVALVSGSPIAKEVDRCASLREELLPEQGEAGRILSPESVKRLYPDGTLVASVSGLEGFAECPFKYFSTKGLRLKERDEFKVDTALSGTFLHDVLRRFHDSALEGKGAWRKLNPQEAGQKIAGLGKELLQSDEYAVLRQNHTSLWETEQSIRGLSQSMEQMVAWMATCSFDPSFSEYRFGLDEKHGGTKAWTIDLGGGKSLKMNGSIDRVDLSRLDDGRVLVAIFDYKSNGKSPNRAKLQNGYELQLLAYLNFSSQSQELGTAAGTAGQLIPAGAFYVGLRPSLDSNEKSDPEADRERKYKISLAHNGRGDRQFILNFDSSVQQAGNTCTHSLQFKPSSRSQDFPKAGFDRLLDDNLNFLKHPATAILTGAVGVQPARFGSAKTACDYCEFKSVCRFEPVMGGFRTVVYKKPLEADLGTDD